MPTPTSTQTIQSYLFFNGRCEEALEFYKKALGAEVGMLMRFKDAPDQEGCPGGQKPDENLVMHCDFTVKGSVIMASDGMGQGGPKFDGFCLSVTATDEAEAQKFFAGLSDGGSVTMPLGKTFYSPCFGMVEDRFGLGWMVIVPQ
ncbi:VOC family protein [soil metagenome]